MDSNSLKKVDKDVQDAIDSSFVAQRAFLDFLTTSSDIQKEVNTLENDILKFDLTLKRRLDKICSLVNSAADSLPQHLCADLAQKLNEISKAMQPSQEELTLVKNSTKVSIKRKDSIGGAADLKSVIDNLDVRKSEITKEWKMSKKNLGDYNNKLDNSIKNKGPMDVVTQHKLSNLNGFITHTYNGSLMERFSVAKKSAAEETGQGMKQILEIVENLLSTVDKNVDTAIENSNGCRKRVSQALTALDGFDLKSAQDKATKLLLDLQIEKLPIQTATLSSNANDKLNTITGDGESCSKNSSLTGRKSKSQTKEKGAEKEDEQEPLPETMEGIVELIDVMENETSKMTDGVLNYLTRLKNQANYLLSDDQLHFEMPSIESYKATDEGTISVKKGEKFNILSREQNGWVLVRRRKSKEEGFIPLFCLRT